MQEILELVLKLTDQATAPVKNAANAINQSGKRIGNVFSRIGRESVVMRGLVVGAMTVIRGATVALTAVIRSLMTTLAPLLAALAVGLSVVNFVRSTGLLIDQLDALEKQSIRTGIAVERLAEIDFVSRLSGTPIQNAQDAMDRITREAGRQEDAFNRLGVSVRDATGGFRDSYDILLDVSDAIRELPDQSSRAAAATTIFGEESRRVLGLLQADIRGLSEDAQFLGISFDRGLADASAAFNDSRTRMGAAIRGIRSELLADFLPRATHVFNTLANTLAENRERIVDFFQGITSGIKNFIASSLPAIDAAIVVITLIEVTTRNLFSLIVNEGQKAGGLIAGLGTILQKVGGIWTSLASIVVRGIGALIREITNLDRNVAILWLSIQGIFNQLKIALADGLRSIDGFLLDIERGAWRLSASVLDIVSETMRGIVTSILSAMSGLDEGVLARVPGFNKLMGAVDGASNSLSTMADAMRTTANLTGRSSAGLDKTADRIDETADRTRNFSNEIITLRQEIESAGNPLANLADMMQEWGVGLYNGGLTEALENIRQYLISPDSGIFGETVMERMGFVRGMWDTLTEAIQGAGDAISNVGKDGGKSLTTWRDLLNQSATEAEFLNEIIARRLSINTEKFGYTAGAVGDALSQTFNAVVSSTQQVVEGMIRGTADLGDLFKAVINSMINTLIALVAQYLVLIPIAYLFNVLTGGGLALAGAANTAAAIASGGLAGGIAAATSQGGGGAATAPASGAGPSGNATPRPQAFAEGGIVTRPMVGLVGEAGPEAIIPLDRAKEFSGGGNVEPVIVNVNISAVDAASFNSMLNESRENIVGVIQEALSRDASFRNSVRSA